MTDARFELHSCGVLVFRQAPHWEFLLMRHADRWDIPKGHVDPGETELECALRELREETGISAAEIEIDPKFVFHHEYFVVPRDGGDRKLKRLTVFLGTLESPREINPSEHLGYAWISWHPPHQIQLQTIDPLLHAVAEFWGLRPTAQ